MQNRSVHFLFTAVAPVFNGEVPEENSRSESPRQRVVPVVSLDGKGKVDKVVPLPAVSGNSTRGKYRKLFVSRSLAAVGMTKNELSKTASYLLLSGGQTGKGPAADCPQEKYLSVYDNLPFFGLVGGSHKGVFWPGRLAVGFAIPVVKETVDIFAADGWPFSRELKAMTVSLSAVELYKGEEGRGGRGPAAGPPHRRADRPRPRPQARPAHAAPHVECIILLRPGQRGRPLGGPRRPAPRGVRARRVEGRPPLRGETGEEGRVGRAPGVVDAVAVAPPGA